MDGDETIASEVVHDVPSFVNLNVDPTNFFAVDPIGDVAADDAMGVRLAEEAMGYARKHRESLVIALALGQITMHAELNPVACGFIRRIAAAAAAGSMN